MLNTNGHAENKFDPIESGDYTGGKFTEHPGVMNDLRTCLETDGLKICYQPLIDIETGKTTGVEALARWRHKTAGPVPPEIFIPLVEQAGHIHTLTRWILNHALRQIQQWKADGIYLDVAVNLSLCNLHDEDFPALVAGLLSKWSVHPARLVLEITESVIMQDPEQTIRVLRNLNRLGIRLALDDFGTGYSSLSRLARLPITELKIDRSLVMDIDKNRKNAMIVRSTIELAKKLGLHTVAEGVENSCVCGILKEYGCDTAQGYLFSRPLDGSAFKTWIAETARVARNRYVLAPALQTAGAV